MWKDNRKSSKGEKSRTGDGTIEGQMKSSGPRITCGYRAIVFPMPRVSAGKEKSNISVQGVLIRKWLNETRASLALTFKKLNLIALTRMKAVENLDVKAVRR